MKILVIGGAGFIGSHLVDRLIRENNEVTILDNLSGTNGKKPLYLNENAEFIKANVNDTKLLSYIMPRFEAIFHMASKVGIMQSNYEVKSFTEENCLGTSSLIQAIINSKCKPKLIFSASNTEYGEGLYQCSSCKMKFQPEIRSIENVKKHGFEQHCPKCEKTLHPIPTPEDTPLKANSIYSLTKKFQEESLLIIGKMYNFPVVILRYFNVFGSRQSLSNPYTGVSAIFTSRIKNNNPTIIYEDGLQTRDFISVHDVVEANILALKNQSANYQIFNIGSGIPTQIKTISEQIHKLYGKEPQIDITNDYRKGDIRHCIADNSKAKEILNWQPKVPFEQIIKELVEWSKKEEAEDKFEKANTELKERGLI